MTTDRPDDFPYEPATNRTGSSVRAGYWRVAKGLQAVDGLTPSPYAHQLAADYVEGKRTISETGELLRRYYQQRQGDSTATDSLSTNPCEKATPTESNGEREADFVSQRIVQLLERNAFSFAPFMLSEIHRQLFQDLDEAVYRPGQYKQEQLVNSEFILNGDSVLYADPALVDRSLSYAFDEESDYPYLPDFDAKQTDHLSQFVARIWQVHPFFEGNTRTVAVFTILYLRHLGFDADNQPFEDHARYFRDALVRSNYRNAKAGALPNRTFLNRFFENLLSGGDNELRSRDLVVQALYDDPALLRNVEPSKAIEHNA